MKLTILDSLRVSKSEQWRWQWAFRTSISIATIAFLALFGPTKIFLTRNGRHVAGPGFAGLVTGMAKDRMLGGTLINSWGFLMSCFLACFLCWLILLAINAANHDNSKIVPNGILLAIVFLLVLVLQCMELPVVGKKFACSIIPLLILAVNSGIQPADIWDFQVDAIIGAGCAVVGNVLPLPMELSTTALQQRLLYSAHSTTAVLADIFKAWQYQSCFNDVNSTTIASNSEASNPALYSSGLSLLERSRLLALRRNGTNIHSPHIPIKTHKVRHTAKVQDTHTTGDEMELMERTPSGKHHRLVRIHGAAENKHWRRLRLTLMTAIQLKRSRGKGLGWYFSNNSSGSKFLRLELIKFLRDGLSEISARNAESKFATFSPLRRYFYEKYDKFASLLRDALSIASILEQKIAAMEETPELNYIYRAFHNMPSFRQALSRYIECLCASIDGIASALVQCDQDGVHPIQHYNVHIHACIAHTAALLAKQAEFETEYYRCRRMVYYEHVDQHSKLYYTKESREDAKSLPLNAEVLMNMNSFLFLSDAICTLIVQFWSVEDLRAVQDCLETHERGGTNACCATFSWHGTRRWLCDTAVQLCLAAQDLFPSQTAAFAGFFPYAPAEQRRIALVRLRSAFSVAVAMTIASAYGLYFHRTLPFIAAFTIAFLAGGTAAGATMVTSLNRAAGTVVACVVAIIVQLILDNGGSGRRSGNSGGDPSVQQQLIIGFAVVLLQFPATVVRSYPMQGYAGTCASFTICIMLFAPDLDSADSTDRIIDTFVGVAIYLAVELVLSAASTEGKILSDMGHVYRGVDDRFAGFYKNFLQFKRRASAHTATSSDMQDTALRELNVTPMNARIRAQGELLRYVELEPGLRRPPSLPPSLLAECVELQELAVRHLQVMFWAVRACAEDPLTDQCTQEHHQLYATLAAAFDSISHVPKSAPIATVNSHGGGGKWSTLATTEDGIETVFRITNKNIESPEILSGTISTTGGSNPDGFLLLPLEGSFVEVGRYVSVVVSFLRTALQDISGVSPPPVRDAAPDPQRDISALQSLSDVSRLRVQSHTEFLGIHIAREELAQVLHDPDLLSKVEAQQVMALFSHFQSILERLLREVVDSVATAVVVHGVRARTPRQNKEVKIVNAMIASTMDLVRALRGLATVVSKLRAHRDIRVTQKGTKEA